MNQKKTGFNLHNLSIQFSLIVIGIPTFVLAIFGLYQIKTQTIAFQDNLEQVLENEAVQLSASLSTALFNFDDEACQAICEAALKKPEIIKITIRDLKKIYLTFETDALDKFDLEKNGKFIQFPISFKREHIGDLEIIATTQLLTQRVETLKKSILWQIVILDLILGCVMSFVLLIRFARPLKELQNSSEKIATGHLDHPIAVHRRDELGALAANLLTMRDAVKEKVSSLESEIDQHQKTSVALKKSRDYIDNILNSMPSMLISLDPELRITQWNILAEELSGVKVLDALGKPIVDVVPGFESLKDKIRATLASGEICFLPKQVRTKDQEQVFEDITVYPLISKYVKGTVIRVDDVTDHVRMEQMVVQSEKMMSVGGLAAGMAHEINNPLAGMMQNAQVVLKRIHEDVPASIASAKAVGTTLGVIREFMNHRGITKQLESINQAGIRASQIVQNMLSFSRKDYSGKIPQNIAAILDQTLELAGSDYDLKKQYDFKKIKIVRDYHPETPMVLCEITKIQQVFFNILKNCAEAMQELGPSETHRFYLKVAPQGDNVVIEIQDNGPGMDGETQKRIFEPFFTTKPVGQGTGLGLSVSYFIVTDNHNGKMSVVSEPGKGSRFVIHLPVS